MTRRGSSRDCHLCWADVAVARLLAGILAAIGMQPVAATPSAIKAGWAEPTSLLRVE